MIPNIQKKITDKEIVLVDCFDTLIFRREHPFQELKRWAQSVYKLYPSINPETLYSDRFNIISREKINIAKVGIYCVYDLLADKYRSEGLISDKRQFVNDLLTAEINTEIAMDYPNVKLIDVLRNFSGKVYVVTDYHFSSSDMKKILTAAGIDFFDEVFSSASEGATKENGALYKKVLSNIYVKPLDCIMIGDNQKADIDNARVNGIASIRIDDKFHKNALRVQNKLNTGKKVFDIYKSGNYLFNSTNDYEEYTLLFYVFCKRLYAAVQNGGGTRIVFLAREGHFLKKLFDNYQELAIPEEKRLDTKYFYCSRRAIYSVQESKCRIGNFRHISIRNYFKSIGFTDSEAEDVGKKYDLGDIDKVIEDFSIAKETEPIRNNEVLKSEITKRFEENQKAFHALLDECIGNKKLVYICDVGWTGRMQQGIQRLRPDIETRGVYFGIHSVLLEQPYIDVNGLIFDIGQGKNKSRYYGVFRANTQFDEQLLNAPHGSTVCYHFNEAGKAVPDLEWDEAEEKLYYFLIKNTQENLYREFIKLIYRLAFCDIPDSPYDDVVENRQMAKVMLKSSLVQSRERISFQKHMADGFIWNFGQQTTGMAYDSKGLQIDKVDILRHPVDYVRYVCKVGLAFDRKGHPDMGRTLMHLYYWYAKMFLH